MNGLNTVSTSSRLRTGRKIGWIVALTAVSTGKAVPR
ncbi:MAG: hypothetical protein QOH57_1520 [Mycobacterium sp.]|nr:hypothetical protein [Mycobacterium sp.]